MDDDGVAVSYKLMVRGAVIRASDGTELGIVERMLENEREHIFDGIVMRTDSGRRFVDAPEVARIAERAVTLTIDAQAAAHLPEYERAAPEYSANVKAGRVARWLGAGWKRR